MTTYQSSLSVCILSVCPSLRTDRVGGWGSVVVLWAETEVPAANTPVQLGDPQTISCVDAEDRTLSTLVSGQSVNP